MPEDKTDYDTFRDLYLDNPQKVSQILGVLVRLGMSPEQAKTEMEAYVATQAKNGPTH